MLTPILTRKLQGQMRLAFTQACVNFPQGLNMLPVHNAVAQCYAYTAKFMGSTYLLTDPGIYDELVGLVKFAQQQIDCREDTGKLLAGRPAADSMKLRPLLRGLDVNNGRVMLSLANNGRDRMFITATRKRMLQDRRNKLANELVDLAVERAFLRFQNSTLRGEQDGQSAGTERRSRATAGQL